jgi:hypothetical protein
MASAKDDETPTPEWPLPAPSDPVELNDTGFDPGRDPLDEAGADDEDLDPELSQA